MGEASRGDSLRSVAPLHLSALSQHSRSPVVTLLVDVGMGDAGKGTAPLQASATNPRLYTDSCPFSRPAGDYSIEETAFWSERVYSHVMRLLNEYGVVLEGILLKPNMCLPGEGEMREWRASTKLLDSYSWGLGDWVKRYVRGILLKPNMCLPGEGEMRGWRAKPHMCLPGEGPRVVHAQLHSGLKHGSTLLLLGGRTGWRERRQCSPLTPSASTRITMRNRGTPAKSAPARSLSWQTHPYPRPPSPPTCAPGAACPPAPR